jgi:hypothetical protein
VFVDAFPPHEAAGDRAALGRLIAGEMERLEDLRRTELDPQAALERAAAADRAMFDDSPAGVLLRRYMTACEREYHRALAAVLKFRKERPPVAAVEPEPEPAGPEVAAEPAPPVVEAAGPVRNEPIAETPDTERVANGDPLPGALPPAARGIYDHTNFDLTPPTPGSGLEPPRLAAV